MVLTQWETLCGLFFAFFEKIVVPILTSGGYVGLSIATLLSQHHKVMAVDIVPEKVELINSKKSPIQDEYIEKYLAEKELDLTATLDAKEAYSDADFVVIAAPTNYDSKKNFFDTSAVMKSKSKKNFAIITNVNDKFLNELEEKLHFKSDRKNVQEQRFVQLVCEQTKKQRPDIILHDSGVLVAQTIYGFDSSVMKKIEKFLREQKPELLHYQKFLENGTAERAKESGTEQNYNMIDGCVNNNPKKPRIIGNRISVLDRLHIKLEERKQKSQPQQQQQQERSRKN